MLCEIIIFWCVSEEEKRGKIIVLFIGYEQSFIQTKVLGIITHTHDFYKNKY